MIWIRPTEKGYVFYRREKHGNIGIFNDFTVMSLLAESRQGETLLMGPTKPDEMKRIDFFLKRIGWNHNGLGVPVQKLNFSTVAHLKNQHQESDSQHGKDTD